MQQTLIEKPEIKLVGLAVRTSYKQEMAPLKLFLSLMHPLPTDRQCRFVRRSSYRYLAATWQILGSYAAATRQLRGRQTHCTLDRATPEIVKSLRLHERHA